MSATSGTASLNYKGEKRAFHKCPLDALKKPDGKQ